MKKNLILSLILITSLMFMFVGSVSAGPTDYLFTHGLTGEAGLVSGAGLGHESDNVARLYIPGTSNIYENGKVRFPYTGTLASLQTFSFWTKVTGTNGELHPYAGINIDADGNAETIEFVIVQYESSDYAPTGVDTWIETTFDDSIRIHVAQNAGMPPPSEFTQWDTKTLGDLKAVAGWSDYEVIQVHVDVGMWSLDDPLEGFVDDVNINGVIYDFEPPCEIVITSPTEGTNLIGEQTIEWTFNGACSSDNYFLNYNPNGCVTNGWVELTSFGDAQTTYSWDTTSVIDGDNYCVEVVNSVVSEIGISGVFRIDNTNPNAVAGVTPNKIDEGSEISFDGSSSSDGTIGSGIVSYLWDFGDEGTSPDDTGYHTYIQDGCYYVTLTVMDYVGLSDTSDIIEICVDNVAPVVDAGGDQNVNEGELVTISPTFTDAGTEDEHTTEINWGDGTVNTELTHTYMTDDVYTVTVTVTDDALQDNEGSDTLTITVNDLDPTAEFSYVGGNEGDEVQFTDESTTPADEIVAWLWEFGDGEISTEQNPTHTYLDEGDYTVTLIVTDSDDSEDDIFHCITIGDSISNADFTFSPENPNEGDEVQFTDTSTVYEDIISWEWNFGDGSVYTNEQNPKHTYLNDGTYDVILTITDKDSSTSRTKQIIVNNLLPTAEILNGPYEGIENEDITFYGDASDNIDTIFTYEWDCSYDGTDFVQEKTGQNVNCSYSEKGTYTVALRVNDGTDYSDIVTTDVTVYDYKIDLGEGWNLISIPLVPENDDTSINNVLNDVIGNVGVVWAYTYDGVSDKNVWSYYKVGAGNLDKIIPGYGYYIKMLGEEEDVYTLYLNGEKMYGNSDDEDEWTVPKPPVVKLSTNSWNLIGHYGLDLKEIDDALTSLTDVSENAYYDLIYDKKMQTPDSLDKTEGYWLSVKLVPGADNIQYKAAYSAV